MPLNISIYFDNDFNKNLWDKKNECKLRLNLSSTFGVDFWK